jgi:hypothetical protein
VQLSTALLCDFAYVRDGLLSSWAAASRESGARASPHRSSAASLWCSKCIPWSSSVPHELELELVGEDGQRLAHMTAGLQVSSSDIAVGEGALVPFAVDLHSVAVPQPGAYAVNVSLDGSYQKTIQFSGSRAAAAGHLPAGASALIARGSIPRGGVSARSPPVVATRRAQSL